MLWQTRRHCFDLSSRVLIMGILNVTPDSFSDGGMYFDRDSAVARALELSEQGTDIIDIGGESTRPGSEPVPAEEEIRRIVPVIESIRRHSQIPISIDTCKASVARAALETGADVINDITAFSDAEMAPLAARTGAGVVLMHMQGTPQTMQVAPHYDDVVSEVKEYLCEKLDRTVSCGVVREKIALDPGIGFGKTAEHNLTILRSLESFLELGRPILVGVSRKSTFRRLLERELERTPTREELDDATAAAGAIAVARGASILRAHHVPKTKLAISAALALRPEKD